MYEWGMSALVAEFRQDSEGHTSSFQIQQYGTLIVREWSIL